MNPAEAAFCLNCATPLAGFQPIGATPGQQFAGNANPAAPASQKGMYSLILAIGGLLCCGPFLGIPAAILGWMELDAIKSGRSPAENKTMAQIGFWGGIVSTVLHIGGYVLWILMGMLSAASNPYYY